MAHEIGCVWESDAPHHHAPLKYIRWKKCNSRVPALKLLNQNNRKRKCLSFFLSSAWWWWCVRWKSAIPPYFSRARFHSVLVFFCLSSSTQTESGLSLEHWLNWLDDFIFFGIYSWWLKLWREFIVAYFIIVAHFTVSSNTVWAPTTIAVDCVLACDARRLKSNTISIITSQRRGERKRTKKKRRKCNTCTRIRASVYVLLQ